MLATEPHVKKLQEQYEIPKMQQMAWHFNLSPSKGTGKPTPRKQKWVNPHNSREGKTNVLLQTATAHTIGDEKDKKVKSTYSVMEDVRRAT